MHTVARGVSRRPAMGPGLLLAVLSGSLLLRVGLAGAAGARSVGAGAAFGVLLLAAAHAAGWQPRRLRRDDLAAGALGTVLLVAAPLGHHLVTAGPALGAGFGQWAPVVVLVAVAEEAFLRGALWEAVRVRAGAGPALAVTTVAFALLHVPLYGWQVLPLDLAAGVVLGGLRWWTGRAAAPAIAHALGDLAGWWLR